MSVLHLSLDLILKGRVSWRTSQRSCRAINNGFIVLKAKPGL